MMASTKHKVVFLTQRSSLYQQRALEAAPPELDITIRRVPSREEWLALLAKTEFLISERSGTLNATRLLPNLRLIQRLGIQTWDIDLTAARAAGVPVCYWPIQGCVMVAEHMLLQILGVLKRVRESMKITADAADWGTVPRRGDEDHFAPNWSKRGDIDMLSGSAVGILGFGEVGLELAIRLRDFDCRLIYNKRNRLPTHMEERYGLRYATLDELARRATSYVRCCPTRDPRSHSTPRSLPR